MEIEVGRKKALSFFKPSLIFPRSNWKEKKAPFVIFILSRRPVSSQPKWVAQEKVAQLSGDPDSQMLNHYTDVDVRLQLFCSLKITSLWWWVQKLRSGCIKLCYLWAPPILCNSFWQSLSTMLLFVLIIMIGQPMNVCVKLCSLVEEMEKGTTSMCIDLVDYDLFICIFRWDAPTNTEVPHKTCASALC